MRVLFVALIVLAGAAACSDSGSAGKPDDKSKKRPVGMSEDIWKAYSGAESGLGEDVKDKKSPDTEKK